METTVGFGASNRSIYALGMDSYCSWGTPEIGVFKFRNFTIFLLAEKQLAML